MKQGRNPRCVLQRARGGCWRLAALVMICGLLTALGASPAQAAPSTGPNLLPSRSTTIALTSDETRLVVVNREANSVSVIRVKDEEGHDVAIKLDEIAVGQEPRCVAVHPTDRVAYVTNAISGTVSVVNLRRGKVV